MQTPDNDQAIERQQQKTADESPLFGKDGESKVGMPLRQEREL